MADVTIRAFFKRATIAGDKATLQLEVMTENHQAFQAVRKSGKYVVLTLADAEQELPFDPETGEVLYD